MSETSTSHKQWIQHAVAAAKAGNPSVAKIHLQKAAEVAPEDPAIWLWMGWLADSPSSAAQCLELARTDKRLEKIAVAGIEFSKALAEFQPGRYLEPEDFVEDDDSTETADDDAHTLNPVEAVEEVVAAVESLQHEDEAEVSASDNVEESAEAEKPREVEKPAEQVVSEAVEPRLEPNSVDEETLTEQLEVDEREPIENVDESGGSSEAMPEDVEAELMQSARELWQATDWQATDLKATDERIDEPVPPASEADEETRSSQQLWQPAGDDAPADEHPSDRAAMTPESTEPVVQKLAETLFDESEEEFAFATDDDEEIESEDASQTALPPAPEQNIRHAQSDADQWLGQETSQPPQAPVWRKAQSDWFSVDGPAEPDPTEPETKTLPLSVENVSARNESPVRPSQNTPEVQSVVDHDRVDSELAETQVTEISKAAPTLNPESTVVVPRVTASDIWQSAAIEKSALMAAPVADLPAPSSAGVGSASRQGEFFAADFQNTQRVASGPAKATSLDQKTVLVVDDSPTVRKLVAITLEKRGYKVVSAFDGVAAIKEIAAHNPSLILMDVNMPRLDGYQLCKLVKKHETTRDIPVLMLTGKDGMFDRLRGRLVGCAGSLAKPFSPEELLEIVEQNIVRVK